MTLSNVINHTFWNTSLHHIYCLDNLRNFATFLKLHNVRQSHIAQPFIQQASHLVRQNPNLHLTALLS